MSKSLIRQEYIHIRNCITDKDNLSERITSNLLSLPQFKNAENFLLYYSLKEEVNTTALIKILLKNKKKVALPKADKNTKTMSLYYITDLEKSVKCGAYGIMEPLENLEQAKANEINLAIIPGVAFDRNGVRLGFGAGFYDKFLANFPDMFKIGICFSKQVSDRNLPSDIHDINMNVIVTELETIYI